MKGAALSAIHLAQERCLTVVGPERINLSRVGASPRCYPGMFCRRPDGSFLRAILAVTVKRSTVPDAYFTSRVLTPAMVAVALT